MPTIYARADPDPNTDTDADADTYGNNDSGNDTETENGTDTSPVLSPGPSPNLPADTDTASDGPMYRTIESMTIGPDLYTDGFLDSLNDAVSYVRGFTLTVTSFCGSMATPTHIPDVLWRQWGFTLTATPDLATRARMVLSADVAVALLKQEYTGTGGRWTRSWTGDKVIHMQTLGLVRILEREVRYARADVWESRMRPWARSFSTTVLPESNFAERLTWTDHGYPYCLEDVRIEVEARPGRAGHASPSTGQQQAQASSLGY